MTLESQEEKICQNSEEKHSTSHKANRASLYNVMRHLFCLVRITFDSLAALSLQKLD